MARAQNPGGSGPQACRGWAYSSPKHGACVSGSARPCKPGPSEETRKPALLLPFASPIGRYNLPKLSAWWLRLGINIELIKPGCPYQNGRHGRMHFTFKKEATSPLGMNSLQQQDGVDTFVKEFNDERPHEALDMKTLAEICQISQRSYEDLPDLDNPFHDTGALVTACGRICMHWKKTYISTVVAGQRFGIWEVEDGVWMITFMSYEPGYFDLEQNALQTIDNPFGARL